MHFSDFQKSYAPLIEKSINESLKDFLTSQKNPKLKPLLNAFADANKGGKRLRGLLAILGFLICHPRLDRGSIKLDSRLSGNDREEILKAAAALEIFQTAILAHDDIIDKSPLRRGEPTLYKKLGGDHYGLSQTMLLGDIGFFISAQILAQAKFDQDKKIKALQTFNQMFIQVGLGEMLDVELPHLKTPIEQEDVLEIHKNKTAYYTIVYPLTIGAILAGANESQIEKIAQFGEKLGIAFQIQDDILGVFGSEEGLGKSVTSDIEEGKNTLLISQALKKASTKQKEILANLYGLEDISAEQLEQIRQIFISTGALDHSRILAVEYVNSAKKLIPELTRDKELIEILEEMSDFLVERNK